MAFLITFSVLLGVGGLWMAVFVWFSEVDSATLNAIADWLSPERVFGWIAYLVMCALCCVPFFKRFLSKP